MRRIFLESVSKQYDGETVLDKLDLEIPAGKFFALLGPSGCGKTSILRLIAGLESADGGNIFLGDKNITNVPIYERRINTVFQQYALFPHLTVFENIAYGLRVRGVPEPEVRDKVHDVINMVRLVGREDRFPKNLSGGQQQRVTLARAVINEPEVLLLDEPLAALDLKLKEQMLIELINLQDKLKTTFVYVTHDQFEALTVADYMAIMNAHGNIEQIGTPKEIYEFPKSRFVANFVGRTNLVEGVLHLRDDQQFVESEELGAFEVIQSAEKPWMIPGRRVVMSIRPEKLLIAKKELKGFSNHFKGVVLDIIYHGRSTEYRVQISNGQKLMIFEQNEEHFPQETIDYDEQVNVYFQKENVVLLEY